MYVIATFESNVFLELAITELEQQGISAKDIMAVPLEKDVTSRKLFDTIHRADGVSVFDAAAILATVFMLLGAIYGYVLKWGPILWGVIGALFGALLGLAIRILLIKRNSPEKLRGSRIRSSEVVLLLQCERYSWETVERILWDNLALGVARVKRE